MEGPRQINSKESEKILKPLPEKGSRVLLVKESIVSGHTSQVAQGEELVGMLTSEIAIGKPIVLSEGSRTSIVKNIERLDDKIRVTTETSVYEMYKLFSGLTLDSDIGKVRLPEDARPSELEPGSAPGMRARSGENIVEVKIDRDVLKNVLIRTGEGVVHVVGDRYMVLARVGGAHVPFYRSSKGTDGKKQGEWYPFFGHTGEWIIKGDIASDGSMNYLHEVTAVQDVLNRNLILPKPTYLNRHFNMTSADDGRVLYALGKDIPLDDFRNSPEFQKFDSMEEAEGEYIKRLTGYDPVQLKGYHPGDKNSAKRHPSSDWMGEILQGVRKAQK